jgi:CRISPR-associated protein Csb2
VREEVYLAFFVHYAVGAHRGKGPGGREFPPHEVRLRAALVRSWALEGKPSWAERALEWLETLPPPLVLAPKVPDPGAHWRSWVAYVPPHDVAALPAYRERQPLRHHVLPLPGRLLAYAYPLEKGALEQARGYLPHLKRLAGKVTYLGTSRNLVWVDARLVEDPLAAYQEEAALEPRVLVPAEASLGTGGLFMRVAPQGFLRLTEERFQAGVRELPRRWVPYREPGPLSPKTPSPSPWGAWTVRALKPSLPLEWAPLLAHAARKALLSHLPPGAPPALTGHGQGGASLKAPHLALVPLPNVGHRHGDGRVLGLAFLLPEGVEREVELALLEALLGLQEVQLNGLTVRLLPPDGRWTLTEGRWRRPARRFASVTPMLFDRYPRRGDFLGALRFSAQVAGFPEPEKAWVLPYPRLQGTPLSRHFLLPPGMEGYVAHVEVLFPEPVSGPVLLGRGRYLGLGLFAPLEVEDADS